MRHQPVLLKEVLEFLQIRKGKNVVDCTLGDGGHTEAILEINKPSGFVLGIDVDAEAVLEAKRYLYRFENRFIAVRDNFSNLKEIIKENNFKPIDGILIDLGWSSPQFAERARGFSFLNKDELLDMRYDKSSSELKTAAELINNLNEGELNQIFRKFGEEKFSNQIAKSIVENRNREEIKTVGQLVEIVLQVYRNKLKTDKEIPWVGGIHPATKIFQALRIAVNRELEVLKKALSQSSEVLGSKGRLIVISFHSLEDRIVKQYFNSLDKNQFKIITKKPVMASTKEIKNNPRARSAKLRVVEKQ